MPEREQWPDPGELISYEMGLRDCVEADVMNQEQADAFMLKFIRHKFHGVFEYYMGAGTD